jgi:colanic acid biosynthesis protein WcaH
MENRTQPVVVKGVDGGVTSPEGLLPESKWKAILRAMPIPCLDLLVENDAKKVLLGFRMIRPYRNVWALPGGRIRKNEYPLETAERNLREIHISAEPEGFIGVFPVKFPRDPDKRYDITLCYRYRLVRGKPISTPELRRLEWFPPDRLPARTGANYRRMIRAALEGKPPRAV